MSAIGVKRVSEKNSRNPISPGRDLGSNLQENPNNRDR
jgi:hypothetical protein